jgi:hypothetical protein
MTKIRRRDLVGVVGAIGFAATAAIRTAHPDEKAVRQDKRQRQYRPDSPEVQNFYRVNRYPAK